MKYKILLFIFSFFIPLLSFAVPVESTQTGLNVTASVTPIQLGYTLASGQSIGAQEVSIITINELCNFGMSPQLSLSPKYISNWGSYTPTGRIDLWATYNGQVGNAYMWTVTSRAYYLKAGDDSQGFEYYYVVNCT